MADIKEEADLLPPQDVVLAARSVMGSIDLDPWSCPDQNLLVQSARYFNRHQEDLDDICSRDWESRGERRAFMIAKGAKDTKRLLHKLLREYRVGRVKEAVVWIQHNESLARLPWLWNFPLCIPFKRLRPCWRIDDLDEFRTFSPAVWSFVAYLPPTESSAEYYSKLARFSVAFAGKGRVIVTEDSGSDDWEAGYRKATGHAYSYR
jgi:hypothetical protein